MSTTNSGLRLFTPIPTHYYFLPTLSWLATGCMNIVPQARDTSLVTLPLLFVISLLLANRLERNHTDQRDWGTIIRYFRLLTFCRMSEEIAIGFTQGVLEPPRGLLLTHILGLEAILAVQLWEKWNDNPAHFSTLWTSVGTLPWSFTLPQIPTIILCLLFFSRSSTYNRLRLSSWSLVWRFPVLDAMLFPVFFCAFVLYCEKRKLKRQSDQILHTAPAARPSLPSLMESLVPNMLPWPVDEADIEVQELEPDFPTEQLARNAIWDPNAPPPSFPWGVKEPSAPPAQPLGSRNEAANQEHVEIIESQIAVRPSKIDVPASRESLRRTGIGRRQQSWPSS